MDEELLTLEGLTIGMSTIQCARYSILAVYALVVYDWFLSLEDEYDLIISARWTFIKSAYLVCRYYPLLIYPIYIWAWLGDHPHDLCAKIIHPLYGFLPVFQMSAQAVILLRAYAFTGQAKITLFILLTCFLAVAGVEIWLFGSEFILVEELFIMFGQSGCFANDADAQIRHTPAVKAGTVLLLSFVVDLLMLLLVLAHSLRLRSMQGSLGKLFLMQGLGSFLLISAFTILSAVLYFGPKRQYDGIALPFMLLSDALACRLILALRRVATPTASEWSRVQSKLVNDEVAQAHLDDIEPAPYPEASERPEPPNTPPGTVCCHFFTV